MISPVQKHMPVIERPQDGKPNFLSGMFQRWLNFIQVQINLNTSKLSSIYSGTYAPTATAVINVTNITTYQSQYMRVGNVVNVSGRIDFTTPALAYSQFTLSIPTAATFTAVENAGGNATTNFHQNSCFIFADSLTNNLKFETYATLTTQLTYFYTAQYLIE
jgi:hypothetical protein